MSFGPTGGCAFCDGIYYLEKLPAHEMICSLRPTKQPARAVRASVKKGHENVTGTLLERGASSLVTFVGNEEAAQIQGIMDRLGITSQYLRGKAFEIYLDARDKRGLSHGELQGAAVYASCRLLGFPKTLKDVAVASGMRRKVIARCYRSILLESDLKMPVQDPGAYVSDIAIKAGLDTQTVRLGMEILEAAKKARITVAKDPRGMAAAALYEAYAELHLRSPRGVKADVTQKTVADAAGVTEATVRNRSCAIRSVLASIGSRSPDASAPL